MAPTRCDCGESVGNHNCVSALKAKVAHHQHQSLTIKRLLDALHAHHNNDESPANCAACRKVLAP